MKRYLLSGIKVRFVSPRGRDTQEQDAPAGGGYLFFKEDVVKKDHPLASHVGGDEIGFVLIDGFGRFSGGIMVAKKAEVQ